jgi:acyl-ACP thioesterase
VLSELVAMPSAGRVFEQSVRAGLADASPSGRVRLDAIARWLQDVAHGDLEDARLGQGGVWVVRRTRIRVETFPRLAERASASTFCSGLGRMWAERRTTITGPAARVEAVALWVHLDPVSGRPTPPDERYSALYAASAAGREVKARLRHPPPDPDASRSAWRFRGTEADIAGHVNNAAYWEPFEELLLAGPEPERIDAEIEFRAGAQPGEVGVLRGKGGVWLVSPQGDVCASIVTM